MTDNFSEHTEPGAIEESEKEGYSSSHSSKNYNISRCNDYYKSFANLSHQTTSFEDLKFNKLLLKAVYRLGFKFPSEIQIKAIPKIINRENFIGHAQHGSGKTIAYVLGILSLLDENVFVPQAIIICPTRELAKQVTSVFEDIAFFTKFSVFTAISNKGKSKKKINSNNMIMNKSHIVVGTPGSILNSLRKFILNPNYIRIFCFDEADLLVNSNFNMNGSTPSKKCVCPHSNNLADQAIECYRFMPQETQILLFSATYPLSVEQLTLFVSPDIALSALENKDKQISHIKQILVKCCDGPQQKFLFLTDLYSLLDSIGQSIIFTQTVASAKNLTNQLRNLDFSVSVLHGKGMKHSERDKVMQEFRLNLTNILVTTNVLSRGIDVESVSLVINYDIPLQISHHSNSKNALLIDLETYIHRIGRAGRFGRKGIALNIADNMTSFRQFKDISQRCGLEMQDILIESGLHTMNDLVEIVKDHIAETQY